MELDTNDVTEPLSQIIAGGRMVDITLKQFLEASALQMLSEGPIHLELPVAYGGGIYTIHACISGVVMPADHDILTEVIN